MNSPSLVFVFADQWRAQAFGYAGDSNARTPVIDAFARESVNVVNAVSGCPVCSPYRASLMTGQYPLTHGMVVNDQPLDTAGAVAFAEALAGAGYDTAYIGKWHIDGRGRKAFVPPERRLGFRTWLGYECTHDYNHSLYYDDAPEPKEWEGYDAIAQTDRACDMIRGRAGGERPFALFLSWGPPHSPYQTAPESYQAMFHRRDIELRPNVPERVADQARAELAGYYAHGAALDDCFGRLLATLDESGVADDTLVVFTSDHGDMLGSHGLAAKQYCHEESIRVPLLMRWPKGIGGEGRELTATLDAPDLMPTLLGLCDVPVPESVEGFDYSPAIRGEGEADRGPALLACYFPFHQCQYRKGDRDYRGLRDERFTYARDHQGPWLLFDNREDPYQLRNLAEDPAWRDQVAEMDEVLTRKLDERGDRFEYGWEVLRRYDVRLTELGDDVYVESMHRRPHREQLAWLASQYGHSPRGR